MVRYTYSALHVAKKQNAKESCGRLFRVPRAARPIRAGPSLQAFSPFFRSPSVRLIAAAVRLKGRYGNMVYALVFGRRRGGAASHTHNSPIVHAVLADRAR